MNTKKRVCIIGAGTSGLISLKHALEKGFIPTVFEAEHNIGGAWARTFACTRLQTPRTAYRFSDLAWDPEVGMYPDHDQMMEYLNCYMKKFDLYRYLRFGRRVMGVEYVGVQEEEMRKWEMWGGNGDAFGDGRGVWHVSVKREEDGVIEVHETDFLIMCIGRFSGFPNIPSFPVNEGPEVFNGKVLHSMEYSDIGSDNAYQLIKGKRVTVVGFMKSALDLAAECANANGVEYPCTMIQRTKRWMIPDYSAWGIPLSYLYLNRFSELFFHKSEEGFLFWLFTILLSPLLWLLTKFIESYYKLVTPMKKYGMVPNYNFSQAISFCLIAVLPDKFYDRVREGSIIVKRSQKFSFCKNGVILDGETSHIECDVVLFATGYKGDKKLENMFTSPYFKEVISGTATATASLYRECVYPRIPQFVLVGYQESLANLYTSELRSKWVAHFLDGAFRLPSIGRMEENMNERVRHRKIYAHKSFRKSCMGTNHIWHNDLLCKDMGLNPKRKKGFFAEWFLPYGPEDYIGI